MDTLILGGSYFIGRSIAEHLLGVGHRVAVLNRGSLPVAGADQLIADRDDPGQMRTALDGLKFNWVIDTSCYNSRQASVALTVLRGCFQRWVYLSTAAVYAGEVAAPFSEDAAVGIGTVWGNYGIDKLAAEVELRRHILAMRARAVALRPTYVYGPANNLPREAWLWARILQGKPIWIPGHGDTPLQFVHVSDLASAVILSLEYEGPAGFDVFNVADPMTHTIREYVCTLAEIAGTEALVRTVPYERYGLEPRSFFPFRDYACVVDSARFTESHGWRPRFNLRSGLEHTYRSLNPNTLMNSDAEIESEERLYRFATDIADTGA